MRPLELEFADRDIRKEEDGRDDHEGERGVCRAVEPRNEALKYAPRILFIHRGAVALGGELRHEGRRIEIGDLREHIVFARIGECLVDFRRAHDLPRGIAL